MYRRIFHAVGRGISNSRETDRPLAEEQMELDALSTTTVATSLRVSVPIGFRPLQGSTPKSPVFKFNDHIYSSNQYLIWGLFADSLND
ncbi:hypothetical protein TNCV_4254741 [Trichonephila clavipes]|nr:hypothetical protein TNCV_4254741 [Trichonephila clavipes]